MIFCHYTGSHSCRLITRSNRAPSVIEKSGASSHQGLTHMGDELDLVGMTFLSLSNLSTLIYRQVHTLLPLNKVNKDFCFIPRDPSLCGREATEQRNHLCSLSNLRDPISRGTKWIHLKTKGHFRNFYPLFLHFLRRCENTYRTETEV